MHKIENNLAKDGYAIIHIPEIKEMVAELRHIFVTNFESRFSDDPARNRNLIKRFSDRFETARLFCDPNIETLLQAQKIEEPVFCGPIVTHYTAHDKTGNSYGLPYHQDWPSMAGSKTSGIVWLSLNECSPKTHSLEIVPETHRKGLLEGTQKDNGYVTKQQEFENSHVLTIEAGDILLMSSFLVHRTYIHPKYKGWKLSISRRFDDMTDNEWASRNYTNAYQNSVDRTLYLKN